MSRYAYNAVVRWSRYRHFYTKNSHTGPSRPAWIKSQPIADKLKLYADVRVGKDINEREDKRLQRSCIWGERKFVRTVVRIGMLLQDTHGKAPANIIDEAIDEALATRDKIINQNIGSTTINKEVCLCAQNFQNPRGTDSISIIRRKTRFVAVSFRKKRRDNKWPVPHRITSDCKLTYIRKTNEWKFTRRKNNSAKPKRTVLFNRSWRSYTLHMVLSH